MEMMFSGWAMSSNSFVFLQRNYALDQRLLEVMIKYYKDSKNTYQLLLFPEGTDKSVHTTEISNKYADTNGLQRYHYLIHPRTTGFNFILNQMRKSKFKW
jgi:lysocardiolipin and lysophospholipid acyltransferase